MRLRHEFAVGAVLAIAAAAPSVSAQGRVRARDLGVAPGIFKPGVNNAITDVAGVKVGHATIISGDSIHTGVTAILPHAGNLFFDRVPAARSARTAQPPFVLRVAARRTRRMNAVAIPVRAQ